MAERNWTADDVADHLEEAFRTLRKLPPVKVQGYFGTWPQILRSAREIAAMEPEPMRVWPSAAAITRLERTFDWVLWIAPAGVFALALVVGARAGTGAFGALVHYILVVSSVGVIVTQLAVLGGDRGVRVLGALAALALVTAIALLARAVAGVRREHPDLPLRWADPARWHLHSLATCRVPTSAPALNIVKACSAPSPCRPSWTTWRPT